MSRKMKSLSEQLVSIIQAHEPHDVDPEMFDEAPEMMEMELETMESGVSTLRRQNAVVSSKWNGKVVSRKEIEMGGELDDEDLVASESEQSADEAEGEEWNESNEDQEGEEGDEEEGDSVRFPVINRSAMDDISNTLDQLQKEEESAPLFAASQVENFALNKAACVKHQCMLWDAALDIRIRLQPMLQAANQLPLPIVFSEITGSESVQEALNRAICNSKDLLIDLKKLSCKLLPSLSTSTQDINFAALDKLLEHWSEKTLLSRGVSLKKFKALQTGLVPSIRAIFSDEDRLFMKTSKKRNVKHLGEEFFESISETKKPKLNVNEADAVEYDYEIYDDTDFYTLLLKDVIAGGEWKGDTNELVNAVNEAKAKSKKKAGKRISKSKQIIYTVQPKLVNFMVPRPPKVEFMADELFLTLFGK